MQICVSKFPKVEHFGKALYNFTYTALIRSKNYVKFC